MQPKADNLGDYYRGSMVLIIVKARHSFFKDLSQCESSNVNGIIPLC